MRFHRRQLLRTLSFAFGSSFVLSPGPTRHSGADGHTADDLFSRCGRWCFCQSPLHETSGVESPPWARSHSLRLRTSRSHARAMTREPKRIRFSLAHRSPGSSDTIWVRPIRRIRWPRLSTGSERTASNPRSRWRQRSAARRLAPLCRARRHRGRRCKARRMDGNATRFRRECRRIQRRDASVKGKRRISK